MDPLTILWGKQLEIKVCEPMTMSSGKVCSRTWSEGYASLDVFSLVSF